MGLPIDYSLPYTVQIVTRSRTGKEIQGRVTITWDRIVQVEECMVDEFNIVKMEGKTVLILDLGTFWVLEDYETFVGYWTDYKSWLMKQRKAFYLPMQ